MYYKRKEISDFLDQVAPFNDEYARTLYKHPVIRKMATDIEELHGVLEKANKGLEAAQRVVGRQRFIIASVVLTGAGVVLYKLEARRWKREQAAKEKTIRGTVS
jgi:hypothetical protein